MRALMSSASLRGNALSRRRGGAPRGAAGKIGVFGLVAFVIWAMLYFFYQIFSMMHDVLFAIDLGWLYFALGAVIVFSLCVVTNIFNAQAQIFDARDNELLLSMPIRPSAILTARILSLLAMEYAFEILVAAPAFYLWLSGGHASAVGVMCFVAGFVLLPLPALAVSCLLAWILSLLTSRFARKNITQLIISLAFLVVYFKFATSLQSFAANLVQSGAALAAAFRRALPPLYFYGSSVADGDPLRALLFALCAVLPFVLTVALLSANFIKSATTKVGIKKRQYREKAARQSSVFGALLRREAARYLSNAMFILNMSLGSIFTLVAAVALVVQRSAVVAQLLSIAAQLDIITTISEVPVLARLGAALYSPALAVCLALMMMASMCCASAALVSLEGGTLWILRSVPVPARDVLLSKAGFHMVLVAPPVLIASVLASVSLFGGDISSVALAIILPQLFILLTALGGLALNLKMPRFDWLNELQPVKQGAPIILTSLGAMALILGAALLYLLVAGQYMSPTSFGWLMAAALAALDILLYRWMVTFGARRFDSLAA
jgi:ABC-2 type transport system permease protein